jgi:hypothetical protein
VSDITAMSEGLANNLATIAGIRTYPQIPDNPALPAAVVSLITVDYDQAMQGGLTNYTFNVNVVVSRVTERRAQQRLYELIQTGTGSVKAAIESDRTLDGEAFDLRVTEMSDIVSTSIGDVEYLTANFVVIVRAY